MDDVISSVSDDSMSISEIIASVDKCINILADIEQSTIFLFIKPLVGSERSRIWQEAGIEETCTLYELPRLLERLQEIPRKQQWFLFLQWVLFDGEA